MNIVSVVKREFSLESLHGHRKFAVDITYTEDYGKALIPVIFTHTFKSFKDWGAFNLLAEQAAAEGFLFIKYNASHNGTTADNPSEITDLASFSNNNLTKELDDLQVVIDTLLATSFDLSNVALTELCLLGHGRGGNIALIKASMCESISKVASWNASDKILDFPPAVMQQWKDNNVHEFWNIRIKKHLPVGYQFVEDYLKNEEQYNMEKALQRIAQPVLLVHGEEDTRVKVERVHRLMQFNTHAKLKVIEKADHMFGVYHPYMFDHLNSEMQQACMATLQFFKS